MSFLHQYGCQLTLPTSNVNDSNLEDSLAKRGRQLTHMVDMFWNAADVLSLGKEIHWMSNDQEEVLRALASDQ